jgi:hypothetical protein
VRFLPVYKKYRDDVEFMMIYVREAHPIDKWWLGETKFMRLIMEMSNPYPPYELWEPETIEERREAALAAKTKLLEDLPVYVDNMDNKVDLAYVAWPTRIYFIDEDGKVRYDSDLGPYGTKPDDLGVVLSEYFGEN